MGIIGPDTPIWQTPGGLVLGLLILGLGYLIFRMWFGFSLPRAGIVFVSSLGMAALIGVGVLGLCMYWSWPLCHSTFKVVRPDARGRAGVVLSRVLIGRTRAFLEKPGGFLLGRRWPPASWLRPVRAWERGVRRALTGVGVQYHDFASLHFYYTPHADQITENFRLVALDQVNVEVLLARGLVHLRAYLNRCLQGRGDFFPIGISLDAYLMRVVEDLAGYRAAIRQGRSAAVWMLRGYTWVLQPVMEAVRIEFDGVLTMREAQEPMDEAIAALRRLQQPWPCLTGWCFHPPATVSADMEILWHSLTRVLEKQCLLEDAHDHEFRKPPRCCRNFFVGTGLSFQTQLRLTA